ncbi:MAG: hypothetical protein K2L02_05465 [Clostridia bacterium]|nr:hypothetical protein [Clostridia bacterium]
MNKEDYIQNENKIKYLIKFVHREHVDYLLHKGLFMNQVNYYVNPRKKEDGQYDCWESLSSSELKLYKNRNRPIWCCTAILIDEVKGGVIKLDKRLLSDFFKDKIEDGRLVLIDFKSFIDKIYLYPDEYTMNFGRVNYYMHPKQIGERFFSDDWSDSIFLKLSKYSYQKEFRVAINRACEIKTEKRKVFRFFEIDAVTSYEPYEYALPDLQSISKTFTTKEIYDDIDKDYFCLNIQN